MLGMLEWGKSIKISEILRPHWLNDDAVRLKLTLKAAGRASIKTTKTNINKRVQHLHKFQYTIIISVAVAFLSFCVLTNSRIFKSQLGKVFFLPNMQKHASNNIFVWQFLLAFNLFLSHFVAIKWQRINHKKGVKFYLQHLFASCRCGTERYSHKHRSICGCRWTSKAFILKYNWYVILVPISNYSHEAHCTNDFLNEIVCTNEARGHWLA